MKKIRIILYEDNNSLREGLTILMGGSPNLEVVGAFKNCNDVVSEVAALRPDVILLDIDMPGTNGIRALQLIREQNDEVKILMLTVFDDDKNIFAAIRSGANGYLLKETSPAKLLEYIQDVHAGGAPMTSSIATQILQMFSKMHPPSKEYKLSEKERDVLQLLVNGYSYKMIAAEMYIAIDTVRSYIKKRSTKSSMSILNPKP
ncbi:response regulator transcription factor [Paraflavitalea speifideaquila]|uniref:response regulator transcription factor n=1 Tax=Paraflavitalea speifideaquila TaxID=3076558 RepID=UPI0028E6F424|nr:response regulator transcription factor [Paraflavitalea speifideiaquila]